MQARQVTAPGRYGLALATRLLQRARLADPTAGLWEAADVNWWWRRPRPSDDVGHLVWLDADGDPVGAVLQTDWGREWQVDPVTVGVDADLDAEVWEAAVTVARAHAGSTVWVREDNSDGMAKLAESGFVADRGDTTMWMAATERRPPGAVPHGYRVLDRTAVADRPHHFIVRSGADVEGRLQETPLYDPTLDLLVVDADDEVAGYALFWFDPVTGVGLVEPVRIEEAHEGRGLGGHLVRCGLERLAARGATRLKISWENPVAGRVYARAGFLPESTSVVMRPSAPRDCAPGVGAAGVD